MENLNLKQLLSREDIQEHIIQNMSSTKSEILDIVEKCFNSDMENNITVDGKVSDLDIEFEARLYTKQIYLLETRLFDKQTDDTIGTYLDTFESDGSIVDFDNDVWGKTQWSLVNK